jgi:hypothetical protein
MAKKDRATLKTYFSSGRRPTQEAFADLIDSTLNIIDHGLDKNAQDGFRVAQLGSSGSLLSFYRDIAVKSPLWSMRLDAATSNLSFEGVDDETGGNRPVLTLDPRGRVGVSQATPRHTLDVSGTVAAHSRLGRPGDKPVHSDGEWHAITDSLDGCRAYEIMAGVGAKGSGRYALLHAFALSTFNGRNSITYHQAHFGSRCNRLLLKWEGGTHDFRLCMKTACHYGEKLAVRYYITELWLDPFMDAGEPA